MFNTHRLIGASLFVLFLFSTALAQENRAPMDNSPVPAAPLVTATATAKRMRFVSPGTVVQLRLEVYNEMGQKLFDTELRGGNVLDWHLQDGAGQPLAAGSYACVLTIKGLSGRLSQRVGLVTVDDKQAVIEAAEGAQLSMAQQQTIGPVEGNAGFTIVEPSEAQAITAVTHDGTESQLSRTRGPLSFRVGDIFSGNDKEQMRLTEEGNLGIGTTDPQVRLDVAGTIRAERIVIAKPKLGSAMAAQTSGQVLDSEQSQPLASGAGTQNFIAKWTDNAGTLGNSQITESGGRVVVGNGGQTGNIQIFGTAVQDVFAGMGPDPNAGPAFNYGYAGFSFGRSAGFFNVRPDALATPPNPSLRFMTANVQRMIVTNTGNVGIGTTAPQQTLHVDGMEILSTGSVSGFKFRNRGSTSSADDWVWYSDGNLARFFRAGVGDLLTITTTGVVASTGGFKFPDGSVQTSAASRPSVLFYNQSAHMNMYSPTIDTATIDGLNNQPFTLLQSSRIVFHTVVRVQNVNINLGAGALHAGLLVEILDASNNVVGRANADAVLAVLNVQTMNSVGTTNTLPAGAYHTRVSIKKQPGGFLDVYAGNSDGLGAQGGQMIVEIFPN